MSAPPRMDVVWREIGELRRYPRNAKEHPEEQIVHLVKSLLRWGWTIPVLLDAHSNVVAGHGRLEAAERLAESDPGRWGKAPTITREEWSEEEAKAYRIADNRLADLGAWNHDTLEAELASLDPDAMLDGLASSMGFDEDYIKSLWRDLDNVAPDTG